MRAALFERRGEVLLRPTAGRFIRKDIGGDLALGPAVLCPIDGIDPTTAALFEDPVVRMRLADHVIFSWGKGA